MELDKAIEMVIKHAKQSFEENEELREAANTLEDFAVNHIFLDED